MFVILQIRHWWTFVKFCCFQKMPEGLNFFLNTLLDSTTGLWLNAENEKQKNNLIFNWTEKQLVKQLDFIKLKRDGPIIFYNLWKALKIFNCDAMLQEMYNIFLIKYAIWNMCLLSLNHIHFNIWKAITNYFKLVFADHKRLFWDCLHFK